MWENTSKTTVTQAAERLANCFVVMYCRYTSGITRTCFWVSWLASPSCVALSHLWPWCWSLTKVFFCHRPIIGAFSTSSGYTVGTLPNNKRKFVRFAPNPRSSRNSSFPAIGTVLSRPKQLPDQMMVPGPSSIIHRQRTATNPDVARFVHVPLLFLSVPRCWRNT